MWPADSYHPRTCRQCSPHHRFEPRGGHRSQDPAHHTQRAKGPSSVTVHRVGIGGGCPDDLMMRASITLAITRTRSDLDRIGLQHRRSGRIDIRSTPQRRGLEVRILDRIGNDQVNLSSEDSGQLVLKPKEIRKSILPTRLEVDEKVNVTSTGIETLSKHRPKNAQSSNTKPGACLRQRLGIDRHFHRHRTILSERRGYDQHAKHVDLRRGGQSEHRRPVYLGTYRTARR